MDEGDHARAHPPHGVGHGVGLESRARLGLHPPFAIEEQPGGGRRLVARESAAADDVVQFVLHPLVVALQTHSGLDPQDASELYMTEHDRWHVLLAN